MLNIPCFNRNWWGVEERQLASNCSLRLQLWRADHVKNEAFTFLTLFVFSYTTRFNCANSERVPQYHILLIFRSNSFILSIPFISPPNLPSNRWKSKRRHAQLSLSLSPLSLSAPLYARRSINETILLDTRYGTVDAALLLRIQPIKWILKRNNE